MKDFRYWIHRARFGWSAVLLFAHRQADVAGGVFGAAANAARQWWHGRQPRLLLAGAPALLAGGGVTVLAVMVMSDAANVQAHYERVASGFLQAQNFPAARIANERLLLLGEDSPETQFALALALLGEGESARAHWIINRLAPLDAPGHAPAHHFLANHFSKQQTALAEQHWLRVIELRPDAVAPRAQLGQLYFQTGRYAAAEPHLRLAAPAYPELSLQLAAVYRARQQPETARRWAEQAAEHAQQQLARAPGDVAARIRLAEAKAMLAEYRQAAAVLEQGLLFGENEQIRLRLAATLLAWSDSLGAEDLGKRLVLLDRGLRHAPHHPQLLKRLVKTALPAGPQPAAQRALLQTLLAQGKAMPTVHLLLGVDASEGERTAEAQQHFQQACAAPTGAVVASNLAWLLAHSEPAEPERALRIINAVVELVPQDARYRLARGRLLARQGQWHPARLDLEAVLAKLPNEPALHQALAEVYAREGLPAKAADHARRARPPLP